jgi:hypothetical protein
LRRSPISRTVKNNSPAGPCSTSGRNGWRRGKPDAAAPHGMDEAAEVQRSRGGRHAQRFRCVAPPEFPQCALSPYSARGASPDGRDTPLRLKAIPPRSIPGPQRHARQSIQCMFYFLRLFLIYNIIVKVRLYMPCDILHICWDARTKSSSWSARQMGTSTRLNFISGYVDLPIPFDIFDRYTDRCSKMQTTANLLPENIPNVIREFGQGFEMSDKPKLSGWFGLR